MELLLIKQPVGLVPATDEAREWFASRKLGATFVADVREQRNAAFHRKFFALLQYAFGEWSEHAQTIEYKGERVQPDFERFRKDVTILAGFYRPVANLKGELRIEAESISFGRMDEARFEELYSKVIDVLIRKVFNGRLGAPRTDEELREIVDDIVRFA